MSNEIQRLNALNRKSYDSAKTSLFENFNFRAINKLFVVKVLQNPLSTRSGVYRKKDSTVYTLESIDLEKSEIPGVNKFWSLKSTRLLDFASGPASTSIGFIPYVKEVVGIDISQDMANAYNHKVQHLGFSEKLKGYCLDIASESDILNFHLSGSGFDSAVCCMAYHHIPDIELVTKRIVSYLKPGGWYFVMDVSSLEKSRSYDSTGQNCRIGSFQLPDEEDAAKHGVAHRHGIADDRLVEVFQTTGLVNIGIEEDFSIKCWFNESEGRAFVGDRKLETLNSKISPDGEHVYEIQFTFIMAYGQKNQS